MHNAGMDVPDHEIFELRQQAGYWRAQHGRAAQRVCVLESTVADLEGVVRALKASLVQSAKENDVLKARNAWLERQVFGAKGEQSKEDGGGSAEDAASVGASSETGARRGGRKRGQQPGKKSAGRQCHSELPAEEFVHDVAELERCCPKCGLAFDDFPGTEDSEEIHWEGLSIFVDKPNIPMDNNRAERGIRNPANGRKNYYGSGAVWSGMLSVMLFSLFQTLEMNHIDPHAFLLSYFEACVRERSEPHIAVVPVGKRL